MTPYGVYQMIGRRGRAIGLPERRPGIGSAFDVGRVNNCPARGPAYVKPRASANAADTTQN